MKEIINYVVVALLSGIGMFFVVSGVKQKISTLDYGVPYWRFDPTMIGIGVALIVGAVLIYKKKF
jgi:hypothetical protein